MYSIVLTMALMNGAATPAFTPDEDGVTALRAHNGNLSLAHETYRHGRRGGCCGCCGGCYGGCSGCCGGCCGGCYGGCCGGCWGCCGGCWGGGGWGGGGRGGYGGHGGYAYGGLDAGAPVLAGTQGAYEYQSAYPAMAQGNNEATIIVRLPAEARLTIDGSPTTSTSAERTFVTPPLTPEKVYHYTLRAEMQRDGKPVTETRDVTVRAGRETRVNLDFNNGDVSMK